MSQKVTRLFGRTDFFNRTDRFLSVEIGSYGLISADRNKDRLECSVGVAPGTERPRRTSTGTAL
ncbi:hypothetical protein EMIT0P43_10046 [Pseudomonas jessenii]